MRARELGMLEEFFGETLKKTWTPQMIREYLKEHPDIKTRNDLFEKCHKIYMWALRYDMMDELFGKRKFWSKEECG